MAFSINMAVITGNVTRDPELRYTPSGAAVCSFGVATNHSVKKGDQWVDTPTFHNIIVWNKQGEFIANSVKKGTKVSIVGRIDNRQYDAKDGTKKYISEIVAETVVPFLDKKQPGEMSDITQSSEVKETKQEEVEDIIIPDEMPF